jgi:hypothetical protein
MPWVHTPELAYTLEAMRIRAELEAQGQTLDQAAIRELAHARLGPAKRWVAEELTLTPTGREILERIAQMRPQYQTAPQLHPETTEDPRPLPSGAAGTTGGHRPGRAQSEETADRNAPNGKIRDEVRWYLEHVPDPDDDKWSPT